VKLERRYCGEWERIFYLLNISYVSLWLCDRTVVLICDMYRELLMADKRKWNIGSAWSLFWTWKTQLPFWSEIVVCAIHPIPFLMTEDMDKAGYVDRRVACGGR